MSAHRPKSVGHSQTQDQVNARPRAAAAVGVRTFEHFAGGNRRMCQPVVMGFVLHRMQSDGYIEFFEIQYSPALCVRVSGLTMTTHHA